MDGAFNHLSRESYDVFSSGWVHAPQNDSVAAACTAQQGLGVEIGGGSGDIFDGEDPVPGQLVVADGTTKLLDNDMRIDPQDLIAQPIGKAGVDGQHHNEGNDPNGDSGNRYQRDERDEAMLMFCPEISQADEPFKHIYPVIVGGKVVLVFFFLQLFSFRV